jgi:ankyrin repeat protein
MTDFIDVARAVYHKDLPALRALTAQEADLRDQDGRTPLMHAVLAEHADPAVVAALIDRGTNVNARDDGQEWTALHFAARDHNLAVVRQLLDASATVDPVDVFGNTPLWRAVMEAGSDPAVIDLLLRCHADPQRKNLRGISPLDLARSIGRHDLVELMEGREG